MKKLLAFTLLIFSIYSPDGQAQNLTMNEHFKYWYYRQRLVDEFIIEGFENPSCRSTGSGLSIPMMSANALYGVNEKWRPSWSENPVENLGNYIGVLATELKLLYLYDEPYEETQQKLFWAMMAYERLDVSCERLYYPYWGCSLNGIFCRDDIDPDFPSRHADFFSRNNYHEDVYSVYKNSLDRGDPLNNGYYNSGDDVIGMFTGWALLVEALADCPYEVVVYNGYRFIEQAILSTQRYMDRLVADDWIGKLINGEPYNYSEELLLFGWAYGFAKAADHICHPTRVYTVPLNINPARDYGSEFSSIFNPFVTIGHLLEFSFGYMSFGEQLRDYQVLAWQMRGNPYADLFGFRNIGLQMNNFYLFDEPMAWVPPNYPRIFPIRVGKNGNYWFQTTALGLAAIGNSWHTTFNNHTFEALFEYTERADKEFFPLLNLYLYSKDDKGLSAHTTRREVISHLKAAPCQGPFVTTTTHYHSPGVEGWRQKFRWSGDVDKNFPNWEPPDDPSVAGDKFTGLDYMLAYNLLWLEILRNYDNENTFLDYNFYSNIRDNNGFLNDQGGITIINYSDLELNQAANNWFGLPLHIIGNGTVTLKPGVSFQPGQSVNIEVREKYTEDQLRFCEVEGWLQ